MTADTLVAELKATLDYFKRSTAVLSDAEEDFRPTPDMMTTAQQVAHVANTVDWFLEGAFRPQGFNMDFEAIEKPVHAVASLGAARAWVDRSFAAAIAKIQGLSEAELLAPLPPGIMEGAPRYAVVYALMDHTAHHRGALTVYTRLNGKTPAMPYMDM
ncbi:MAG: DinB family protein [Candidatus Hydrogenedentes bacterium]|nr:DinB family protein [Candidatus Hydrogenedentota bacterium]